MKKILIITAVVLMAACTPKVENSVDTLDSISTELQDTVIPDTLAVDTL